MNFKILTDKCLLVPISGRDKLSQTSDNLINYLFSLSWFLTDFYVVKEVEGTFNKDEVSICRAISTDVKIKELKCLLRLIFGSAPIIWSPGH